GAEARQHLRQVLGTDIEVLAHPPPQERGRNVPVTAFRLDFAEHVQDDPLLAGEPVADVGQCILGASPHAWLYTRTGGYRHPTDQDRAACRSSTRVAGACAPDGANSSHASTAP